jgi:hypothetical protein
MTQYQIDDITMSLLEEVLNMAQRTVEIQYDLEIADSMQLVLAEVAERFNIASSEVTDTGQVIPIKGPPTLTIVD